MRYLICILVIVSGVFGQDTLFTNSGNFHIGILVRETSSHYVFKKSGATRSHTVPKQVVEKVVRDSSEKAPPASPLDSLIVVAKAQVDAKSDVSFGRQVTWVSLSAVASFFPWLILPSWDEVWGTLDIKSEELYVIAGRTTIVSPLIIMPAVGYFLPVSLPEYREVELEEMGEAYSRIYGEAYTKAIRSSRQRHAFLGTLPYVGVWLVLLTVVSQT